MGELTDVVRQLNKNRESRLWEVGGLGRSEVGSLDFGFDLEPLVLQMFELRLVAGGFR